MLDTVRVIETPEGVSIKLRLAGPVPRALAWLFDSFVRILVGAGFLLSLSELDLGKVGIGIWSIFLFLLMWFYPVLFEVYGHGATPGKNIMGLAVLRDDGIPVGWSDSIVRNLLAFIDFLPMFYTFGLCSILLNRDFKRLGDIVAKTVVVHRDNPRMAHQLPPGRALPLPIWLSSAEQQLIVSFAARVPQLTPARAKELAQILNRGRERANAAFPADVPSLLGYAQHIAGER
jgi:uncharacterized RDD family membrane protein YckC